MFNYVLFYLILVSALPRDVTEAQADQPGFISLDCGLQGQNYTDKVYGVYYISDAGLVDGGVNGSVPTEYTDNRTLEQYKTVRYFPEGLRHCYTLRPAQGKDGRYLIRARFMYGNYDGLNQPPKFDIYIGLQYWETVIIEDMKVAYRKEIIHTASSDYINVCLVKTGPSLPFISTLELRPLTTKMYPTKVPKSGRNLAD